VIELNEQARRAMKADVKLVIVPHATHLFEEPGALEKVSELACRWFNDHLSPEARKHMHGLEGYVEA